MNAQVTYFPQLSKVDEPYFVSVDSALHRIRTGKCRPQVERIRSEADKAKRSELKKLLPCILFAGKFNKRYDADQVEHSGLAVVDFDHVQVDQVKTKLKALPFVYAAFTSPSGDGVKALVRIPPDINNHRDNYLLCADVLNSIQKIDLTSQNPSRICFESWDEDIYINEHATIYTGKKPSVPPRMHVVHSGGAKVDLALAYIKTAVDGEKHAMLLKASVMMGALVKDGIIDFHQGEALLMAEIAEKPGHRHSADLKTIHDGLRYGLQHGEGAADGPILISPPVASGFLSTRESEQTYMNQVLDGSLPMGLTTGIPSLDEHFLLKRGNFVCVNAFDNTGKTAFLLFLIKNSNINHGWKWIIFSGENSEGQIRKSLIQFKTGKPLKHLTKQELKHEMDWAYENFQIIRNDRIYSCEEILDIASGLMAEKKYDGLLIDPFNSLELTDKNEKLNSHEYQYRVTSLVRVFKQRHDCSVFMSMHAVTEALRRVHKGGDYDGYPAPPGKGDSEGGGKFANRADDFLTIHRYTQHPTEFNVTHIHVRKIKDTETGGHPTLLNAPVKVRMEKGKFGFFPVNERPGIDYGLKNFYETDNDIPPPF